MDDDDVEVSKSMIWLAKMSTAGTVGIELYNSTLSKLRLLPMINIGYYQ